MVMLGQATGAIPNRNSKGTQVFK